jgi:metal-responsive CopG/Arc/MetJ family transcriptional regulator
MSRLLSVSVPDDLADEIESLAATSGKTKSELVRDALRRQIRLEQFSSLQSFGQDQAEAAGVGPEDVEELIDQFRAE